MTQSTIFVYGPPGSGKSTLGRLLAEQLALTFYDLDDEIESRTGCTIPEIFASQGEDGFRQNECQVLERLLADGAGVIALGGGALTYPPTSSLSEVRGRVLLLTASPQILLERLGTDRTLRPLLAQDKAGKLKNLLQARAAHYASFPLRLDTSELTPEEVAWEAQVLLGMFRVGGMGQAYDVRVQRGGLDALGAEMKARGLRGPLVLVSDSHVGPLYAQRVAASLQDAGYAVHTVLLPAGERHKTMRAISGLWQAFLAAGVERGSTVLALGGGVVGDLAGFAASTFLRGVPWVCVPTTLLAMADASLGGKTGADLPQGKNLVGAFHPPRLVLADPATLTTLPRAEVRNGMAEVVKHGVIADPELFELCRNFKGIREKGDRVEEIVRRSMAVKIRVIQADPYEQGRRAALNLGHTVGHAVEVASGYRLRHGEAVAIGMLAEARLAEAIRLASKGLAEQIAAVLRSLRLPTEIPPGLDRAAILQAMEVDKKRAGGKIRFALPERIGEVKVGIEIDHAEIIHPLEEALWSQF